MSATLRSFLIEKARFLGRASFLVAASALILVFHAVDVVQARGPNWPALGIRVVWALLLLANAGFLARARFATIWVTAAAANVGTAVLYLSLLAATGWSRSPLYPFTFVLVIVLPVLSGELMAPALVASATLFLGAGAMLAHDGVPFGNQVGWYHAGVVAFAVSWLLAVAEVSVRRRARAATAAREEALVRLSESERLAAVGRLAAEVAHEVNNPLASARSTAAFLRDGPVEASEARAAWQDLMESLDRIAALVRTLQGDVAPGERAR